MAKHHVKQHWVPKSYAAAWCDPATPPGHEPYTWVFPVAGGEGRKRPPKKLFFEPDMYTVRFEIPGFEVRDLHIEFGLADLESAFTRTRDKFLERRKAMPEVPKRKLLAFVAAQQWRTPLQRRHIQTQYGKVLELMDDLKGSLDSMTAEQRKFFARGQIGSRDDGSSMTHDQVQRLVDQTLQTTLVPHVENITPMLARLRMTFLYTESSPGFITSDNPCIWFDSDSHNRPSFYRSPALMYPTLEITMPISPRCMLLLSHRAPAGFIDVDDGLVRELNRRTRAYADEWFISRSGTADPRWYELGEPPSGGASSSATQF